MKNFFSHIKHWGEKSCFFYRGLYITFEELVTQVEIEKQQIQKYIHANTKHIIALQAEPSPNYFIKLMAIAASGHIALPYIHESEIKLLPYQAIYNGNQIQLTETPIEENLIFEGGGIILQTSGITGTPKIVLHSFDLIANKYLSLKSIYKSIFLFSPEHISGLETTLSILAPGGCIYFPEDREPLTIALNIEKHQIDLMACTPTFLRLLLISNAFKIHQLQSLRIINYGAERMELSLLEKLKQLLPNTSFNQAFGTTETSNIRTYTSPDSYYFKPGIEGKEYKIIDGKLYLKMPASYIKSYIQPITIIDGWYETGDLVEMNDEGYIKIIARNSELIFVGGEKVSPEEVESIIATMPEISAVSVTGEKNIVTGAMVVARIMLSEGIAQEGMKEKIRKHCAAHLPSYKVPQKILFVEELSYNRRWKRV